MKRLLAALGCVAFIGIFSFLSAPHDANAVVMREQKLRWITTQVPALPDSDVRSRSAAAVAAATAQPSDTTQWFPIWEGLDVTHNGTTAVLDTSASVGFFVLYPSTALGIATTMDTVSVVMQVSTDGLTPVAVTKTFNAPWLETSSNNSVYLRVTIGGREAAANGTAPTNNQLGPYRMARFIITGDESGQYQSVWRYMSPDNYVPGDGRKNP